MVIEVIMPKAGMDMQEGQIVKWMKNEGDYVKQGEILLEITTDNGNRSRSFRIFIKEIKT